MNIVTLMILGALQGLLEWLPVSSQGMLTLLMTLLGETPSIALDYAIFLHAGTMLSALVYYRNEFKAMIKEGTLLKFAFITTLLTGLIGGALYLLVKDITEIFGTSFILIIGLALLFTGFLQLRKKSKGLRNEPNTQDAVITGLAQSLSIIPGISRSGITTSTLLFSKFNGVTALKLSFILSVPVVLIAQIGLGLLESPALTWEGFWGLMTAFIVGLITIKALTTLAQKINFGKFCIAMGLITLIPTILFLL